MKTVPADSIPLNAAAARFSPQQTETVDRPLSGVALRPDADRTPDRAPDLIFSLEVECAGRYWINSLAATRGEARAAMGRSHSKFDSLRLWLAVDDDFPRSRVVVSPWQDQDGAAQELQNQTLSAGPHTLRVWLPPDVVLSRLELRPYLPPPVPAACRVWQPAVVPGAAHPRVWVTPETLPELRANLTRGENLPVWRKLCAEAAAPHTFTPDANGIAGYEPELLRAAVLKAFVFLMNGDRDAGRTAVGLMGDYLAAVEFDNLLDITRELGEVIYAGARVYDWCYPLLTPELRRRFADKLLRLAESMEIGWPPFRQPVVNGHGNEAQVSRDLLAMAIALYGEENEPYRYCSYLLLGELAPMRALEYECDRHNQGVGYGAYRFAFEMHGAWMLRRMCGRELYHPNLKNLYNFWFYHRQPDGRIIQDGDGISGDGEWQAPMLAFQCATYAADPRIKRDFLRSGGEIPDPTLFLLLNDPALPADRTVDELPLVHHFRGCLDSMVLRTGWNLAPDSADAVIAFKGGNYSFGNHHHADAGSFQIFYKGELAVDLGMYVFYGTPYDFGYNKRSISHSLMLAHDPDETFQVYGRNYANDGGQRFTQAFPLSLAEITSRPELKWGDTLAAFTDGDRCAILQSDLTAAYSDKVALHLRTFCALRLDDPALPAMLVVVDRMRVARPEVRKYFQINSLTRPEAAADGLVIRSPRSVDPGRLTVTVCAPEAFELTTYGGADSADVFGTRLESPKPEHPLSRGWHAWIAPRDNAEELFVTVMRAGDDRAPAGEVVCRRTGNLVLVEAEDRLAIVNTVVEPLAGAVEFELPADASARPVYAVGLRPGNWRLECGGRVVDTLSVAPGAATLALRLDGGSYRLAPAD